MRTSLEEMYHSTEDFVSRHAEERPYALLGAAAGIGFVLGGGLSSRGAGLLLSLGSRLLINRVLDGSVSIAFDRGERG